MFSTTRINLGMGNIFGFGNNYIAIGYKFFPAFGNGFLIAFLTSVILNYRKEFHGEYYTTDIISDAVKEFLKLSLIILVITVIVVFTKNSTLYDFGLSDFHGEYYTTDIISDAVKEFLKLSLIILVITVIVVFTKNSTLYDFGLSDYSKGYYTTDIISDAVKEFLKLSLIILVITVIVVFTKNSTLYDFGLSDYSKGGAVIAYIMQMAAYLITIATGGIVHVGDSSSMSIFSIFNSATFTDTKRLIRIIFCVFAIAMIFVGANIYRNYRFENRKTVLHFSIAFGFLVGLVAKFSSISISGSMMQNMSSMDIYRNYRFENRKTVLHFSIAFGFLVGLVAKFSSISISGSMMQNMSSMDLAVRAGSFTTFVISILFTVVFTEIGYRVAPHLDDLFK